MHIAGVPYRNLMAICWWRSLDFMVYIQQQISSFSMGVLIGMSKQPWFRHLWVVGRPLIPSSTHSTHLPSPDPSVWLRDILFWTAWAHIHTFHRVFHFHVFQPKILLTLPAGGRFNISDQKSVRIPQPECIQKLLTNHPSIFPSWGPSHNFLLNILLCNPARVHSKISHKTPIFWSELTYNYRSSRIPS